MDSAKKHANKRKWSSSSKSQFNKNIRQQLQTLDCIRKNDSILSINSPIKYSRPSVQSRPHSIEILNDLLPIEHDNILNPAKQSLQTFPVNNNTSQKIIISTELKSSIPENLDSNSIPNTEVSIPDQLRAWAIRNKITHVACIIIYTKTNTRVEKSSKISQNLFANTEKNNFAWY